MNQQIVSRAGNVVRGGRVRVCDFTNILLDPVNDDIARGHEVAQVKKILRALWVHRFPSALRTVRERHGLVDHVRAEPRTGPATRHW
jgi:hypothetical protein